MSNHYYMKIGSLEMAIAILSGDVERVETLLRANNNQPVFVALNDWYSQSIVVDSYLLAYVLYDAFRYDASAGYPPVRTCSYQSIFKRFLIYTRDYVLQGNIRTIVRLTS